MPIKYLVGSKLKNCEGEVPRPRICLISVVFIYKYITACNNSLSKRVVSLCLRINYHCNISHLNFIEGFAHLLPSTFLDISAFLHLNCLMHVTNTNTN